MPAENARDWNSRIGIMGARARCSHDTKATENSSPTARLLMTSTLAHPVTLPRSRPHTSARAATATSTRPGISSAATGPSTAPVTATPPARIVSGAATPAVTAITPNAI